MKIVNRNLDSKSGGSVRVIPEEIADLWHLFNIIAVGDKIKTKTMRKVKIERGAGKTESTRSTVTLELICSKTDFDPETGSLRVTGQVCSENKIVALGQFHTVEIEYSYPVTITKDEWDSVHLQILKDASDVQKKADVIALLIDQRHARLILITPFMSLEKLSLELNTTSKRFSEQQERALKKSFDNIIVALEQNVDWEVVKCILLAGPGFMKLQFRDYLLQTAQLKDNLKSFWRNKERFLVVDASSAHFQALNDIMQDENVKTLLEDTKAYAETQALMKFKKTFRDSPLKAIYGLSEVTKASQYDAIDTLLITDELMRVASVAKRKMYVELADNVKKAGGTVHVFSTLHSSGAELKGLTGIAAILRYALELDSESDETDEDD